MCRFNPLFASSVILIAGISLFSCFKPNQQDFSWLDYEPELILKTGFEGNTRIVATAKSKIDEIVGVDHALKGYKNRINNFDDHPNIGDFRIYYEDGDSSQRYARIVADPTDPGNRVLQFWLASPNVPELSKGRVQADIYNNVGLKEIYQSVRIYLPADLEILEEYPGRIWWLNLFELWNNPTWGDAPYPFKISVNIKKPDREVGTPLYFGVKAREAEGEDIQEYWEEINTQMEVPLGQWITVDTYILEGNAETGRFYMAVTPKNGPQKVIFDIHGFTYHPDDPNPDGFSDFNPMKLYTSKDIINYMTSKGKVLQVFWDDYELWKYRRPESQIGQN